LDVLGLLGEGHANVLHWGVQLEQVLGIFDVFLRERGAVDLHIWDVHALPGFELAPLDNFHLELRFRDLFNDVDLHEPVLNEQVDAWLCSLDKRPLL